MREIKFRWKIISGERVYWLPAYTEHRRVACWDVWWFISNPAWVAFAYQIISSTLWQYAWLKDKNWKEIYGSDLIKYEWNSRIREVYRDENKLQFRIKCYWQVSDTTCDYSMEWLTMEVVGNIYETDLFN